VIEAGLAVTEHELELARQILAPRREAVFRLHGAMIEKAVHQEWAYAILARADSTSISVALEASG
jgi:citrate lyase beta subunit